MSEQSGEDIVPMNTPIATRTLSRPDGSTVELQIGTPVLDHDGEGWTTPWSITGLSGGRVALSSGGMDSMQALVFALAMSGARLSAEGEELTFLGGPPELLTTSFPGDPDISLELSKGESPE